MLVESKSVASDIANKFVNLFNVERFKEVVNKFIEENYSKGVDDVEKQLGFNVQLGDQERDLTLLKQYAFDNIKGMTDELQGKLRQELQRGLMGNETPRELKKRIANVFKGNNPTRFKFEDRVKMITRTESKRASNMAKYNNASKLNRKLYKYTLNGVNPCPGCVKIARETQAKPLPFQRKFTYVSSSGKVVKEQFPPFHVNCRDSLVITQDKEGIN